MASVVMVGIAEFHLGRLQERNGRLIGRQWTLGGGDRLPGLRVMTDEILMVPLLFGGRRIRFCLLIALLILLMFRCR